MEHVLADAHPQFVKRIHFTAIKTRWNNDRGMRRLVSHVTYMNGKPETTQWTEMEQTRAVKLKTYYLPIKSMRVLRARRRVVQKICTTLDHDPPNRMRRDLQCEAHSRLR